MKDRQQEKRQLNQFFFLAVGSVPLEEVRSPDEEEQQHQEQHQAARLQNDFEMWWFILCNIYLRIFKRRDCIWCVTCLFQYVTVLTTVATICQRGIPPLVTSLLLNTVENQAWTKIQCLTLFNSWKQGT